MFFITSLSTFFSVPVVLLGFRKKQFTLFYMNSLTIISSFCYHGLESLGFEFLYLNNY